MPPMPPVPAPATAAAALDAEGWLDLVSRLDLKGAARQLAVHAGFVAYSDGILRLSLAQGDEFLKTELAIRQLREALAGPLQHMPDIRFEAGSEAGETLERRARRARDARQDAAEQAFLDDPDVRRLMARGATLVPGSIRPLDD